MDGGLAEALHDLVGEHIHSAPDHQVGRLEMKIESAGLQARLGAFPQIKAKVRLIGRRVEGEARIAVDLENALVDLGHGHDFGNLGPQARAHGLDESPGRGHDLGFVNVAVGLEPGPVVVAGQVFEELDGLLGESLECGGFAHGSFSFPAILAESPDS